MWVGSMSIAATVALLEVAASELARLRVLCCDFGLRELTARNLCG